MNFIQSLKESIGGYYRNLVSSYVRRLHSHLEVLEGRVSGLYAHLESRGVPMPTDESGNPLPKDTLHLLPTLRHLDTRKVECYETEGIEDGVSLMRLLSNAGEYDKVTEYYDHSSPWKMSRSLPNFPNLRILKINAERIVNDGVAVIANSHKNIERIELPEFTGVYISNGANLFAIYCPTLKEFIAPKLSVLNGDFSHGNPLNSYNLNHCVNLHTVVLGKLTTTSDRYFYNCPSVIHMEIGEGVEKTITFSNWNPTMALRTDTDAEDYIDLREDKSLPHNLAQFQSNFHEYIAKRLATFPVDGSHPTLTLSQTVRDAITQQSEDLIVATKHWSLAPARTPSV